MERSVIFCVQERLLTAEAGWLKLDLPCQYNSCRHFWRGGCLEPGWVISALGVSQGSLEGHPRAAPEGTEGALEARSTGGLIPERVALFLVGWQDRTRLCREWELLAVHSLPLELLLQSNESRRGQWLPWKHPQWWGGRRHPLEVGMGPLLWPIRGKEGLGSFILPYMSEFTLFAHLCLFLCNHKDISFHW